MSQRKKVYLEAMRIAAVLLIIFNHTDGTVYYQHTESILTWLYSIVGTLLCRAGVPLFFMISGALLLDKEETVKELLTVRAARIAVVLFCISLFYYGMDIFRYGAEGAGAADFLKKFLTNGIRESLWFLYGYLGMLLTLPFFRKMLSAMDGQLIKYLIALKCFFDIGLVLVQVLFQIQVYLDPGFVGDPVFYMILGWYLENETEKRHADIKGKRVWAVLITAASSNILLMCFSYFLYRSYDQSGLDWLCIVIAPCIWLLLKKSTEKISPEGKMGKIICRAGACTFGIYLLDNFVRWQLLPLYLALGEKTAGVIANSVYVVLTFLMGFVYTLLLKYIPIIRKYI